MKLFDIIVIGAGSGGLTASIGLSRAGKKVLLVEADKIGGDCTNTGCVPSKSLLHQASIGNTKNPFDKVRSVIKNFLIEESPEKIKEHGVSEVVLGKAQFVNKNTIAVNGNNYSAKYIIIATGSHPRTLQVPGIEHANIHTSDTIFTLKQIPKKLLVIGSGPIGMELGQAFRKLGSEVTIASIDAKLGRLEEPEVAKEIQKQFKKDGITFMGNAYIKEFKKDGTAVFEIKNGDTVIDTVEVENDTVLISIGRKPNIDLNLEAAGIKYNKYGIKVNKKYKTNIKNIFAIGDVSDKFKFTHVADDAARTVIKELLLPLPSGLFIKNRIIPKVTYTTPELAQVGLSHKEAIEKYGEDAIMKIVVPFEEMIDRAKIDKSTGVLVVITKRISGKIIGAHIAHARAGDMISFFTLAIKHKTTLWKMNHMIFPYPSYSLAIKKASDIFLAETLKYTKQDILNLLKKHLTKIFALVFWLSVLYLFNEYKATYELDNITLIKIFAENITNTFWGPLLYIGLYIFSPLIFLPAIVLSTLSGMLFGFWDGFIFTFLGANISASFVYFIGRFFGKGAKIEDTALGKMITKIKAEPFISVLLARLLFLPYDLTNFASGVIKARWRSYALATAIGIIPGTATFVALGASFENINEFDPSMLHINPMTLIGSAILFIFSLILAKILRKYKQT